MKIHEECGVFGVMTKGPADVAMLSYLGLYALQHRGQESCGIVVNEDGIFHSHKDLGLVSEVFTRDVLSRLPKGNIAVAHTRYGTTGATSRRNCQPLEVNHQKGHMAIAHNGNLSNAAELRSELELSGAIFHTTSDTETIAYIITRERLRAPSIEEAVSRAMNSLEGAYSLVIMSPQKLICARDPYGFRPLCYGRMEDGSYVIASESCALTAVLPKTSFPAESIAAAGRVGSVFSSISILPGPIPSSTASRSTLRENAQARHWRKLILCAPMSSWVCRIPGWMPPSDIHRLRGSHMESA